MFILSVAVLGGISLRQHQQLEQIQYVSRLETQHQAKRADALQFDLIGLKSTFEQQIEREIASRIQQRSLETDTVNAQQLHHLEQSLQELAEQVNQISESSAQNSGGMVTDGFLKQLNELNQQINKSREQLTEMTRYYRGSENIVADYSPGVCLIQGAYMFVDPKTEEPLRYTDETQPKQTGLFWDEADAAVEPVRSPSYAVSVHGKGKALLVEYTGTGFLIDARGYLLTNRHVTAPWKVSREYEPILKSGYEPRLCMFQVFFPNQSRPLQAEIVARSETEDVALLYANVAGLNIKPLVCEENPDQLKVGETVLVLGYPTGFDMLLARISDHDLSDIFDSMELSFEQMACQLAEKGLIQPVATRGMCGRVSDEKIIYDAQTAIGGSGAPVFGSDGKVVAINTALMKGFPGTNFGIPIQEGLSLLQRSVPQGQRTNLAGDKDRPYGM
jgi:S1-C subfamily serine protease